MQFWATCNQLLIQTNFQPAAKELLIVMAHTPHNLPLLLSEAFLSILAYSLEWVSLEATGTLLSHFSFNSNVL